SYGPAGGVFPRFDQLAIGNGDGVNGQFDRWCQDLAAMNFGGKADWRRPTQNELLSLFDERGDMYSFSGWPADEYAWTSTTNGPRYYRVMLGSGMTGSVLPEHDYYATCVSGS
ncbi:hypothetical protein BOO91_18835, partial [Vibrio navarrensis]